MYAQDNNSLPVWIIVTSLPTHISINSHPFLVGIVSHSSTAAEPRQTSNQKLASFRKGIKREETAYPTTLKDERYFDSFSRNLDITAKSHECEEVLDLEYNLLMLKRSI